MIKWKPLFKDYYLGIFVIGIIAYIIQEIPYLVMPFINLNNNPIMNMEKNYLLLEILQNVFGILSIILLIFVVKKDDKFFSIKAINEKVYFILTLSMIVINFIGWIFYYANFHNGLIIVISQFAAVPLYYLFIGLWRKNYLLVFSSFIFFIIHMINGCLNFLI